MKEPDNDEEAVLSAYLGVHAQLFMTDFERRCLHLGTLLEKSEASPNKKIGKVLRDKYEQEADEKVKRALMGGVNRFYLRILRRLRRAYSERELSVNRCPECNRIVRTPQAKQCLWCGHDWH